MNQSPYTPPQSDLEQPFVDDGTGSIEQAIEGQYDFSINEILQEAWEATDGYKLPIAIASSVYTGLLLAVLVPLYLLLGDNGTTDVISQLVQLLFAPMGASFFIMGIHMATKQPISYTMLFTYYDKLLPIVGLQVLIFVAVFAGFLLLIIPGIYLSLAVMFAMPLLVEKNLSIVEAFETSRKAVTHHWFKFFGLWFAMGCILLISILPLGIGLFWTIPMLVAVLGILYRRIFGLSASVNA